jgi:hypothetical protein
MLGFGAFGQFAIAQASAEAVISAQVLIDDSGYSDRRKRQKKQQDREFEELHLKRETLRGNIYYAIHPPQEFKLPEFDIGSLLH